MNVPLHDIGYLLTAYAEGTLNEEGRQWVEAQLALHPQLHEQLESIRQVRQALMGTLPAAPSALDQLRHDRLLAYAQEHHGPPARRWRRYLLFTAAAAMAAGVALFLGIPGISRNRVVIEELGKESDVPASAANHRPIYAVRFADRDGVEARSRQTTAAEVHAPAARATSGGASTLANGAVLVLSGPDAAGTEEHVADGDERRGTHAIQEHDGRNRKPSDALKAAEMGGNLQEGPVAYQEALKREDGPSQQAGPQDRQRDEAENDDLVAKKDTKRLDAGDAQERTLLSDTVSDGNEVKSIKTLTPTRVPESVDAESAQVGAEAKVGIASEQMQRSLETWQTSSGAPENTGGTPQDLVMPVQESPPQGHEAGKVSSSPASPALSALAAQPESPSATSFLGLLSTAPDQDQAKAPATPARALRIREVDLAAGSLQDHLAVLTSRHTWWTSDRQVLQGLRQACDGAAAQCIDRMVVGNGYRVHDGSYAEVLLAAARRHQLQLRIDGGCLSVHAHAAPLDPTSLYGWNAADFHSAFETAPMQSVRLAPTLTFALSSDTSSFQQAQATLSAGRMPDPSSIQSEQFINAMPLEYPPAQGPDTFMLYADAGPSPFAAGPARDRTALVSVGVVTRAPAADERRPLHLTVAVDCSGSMGRPGALNRVQVMLHEMVSHLHADDQVCLVRFSDAAQVALPPTPGDQSARINQAIDSLQSVGATNGAEGLALAYQLAAEDDHAATDHRVLFATDGASLSGPRAQQLLDRVSGYQARGISLLVVGCGSDDQQQRTLQLLADHAHGQHVYLASDEQAVELARGPLLPEHLQVLARDAKVQVTWNADRVSQVRLIGYEQRRLANRDFRNDDVVAGQLAHDVQVTALFEVQLQDGAAGPLGDASVRCYDTRFQAIREQHFPLPGSVLSPQISPRLQLCACAAQLAELLQHGWWSNVRLATYDALEQSLQALPPSPAAATLQRMCEQANSLEPAP